jgi:hypothetical protein
MAHENDRLVKPRRHRVPLPKCPRVKPANRTFCATPLYTSTRSLATIRADTLIGDYVDNADLNSLSVRLSRFFARENKG